MSSLAIKANDYLEGRTGFDKLDGGEGNDTYAFSNTAEMRGIITDRRRAGKNYALRQTIKRGGTV